MKVYEFLNYRQIIKTCVQEQKQSGKPVSYQQMAEALRVQSPFLSKVVNLHAHLSSDQLFLACSYLGFDEDEQSYVELLHAMETSGIKKRQDALREQVQRIRARHLDTKTHLSAHNISGDAAMRSEYYLDPLLQIVHVCLSIERYQRQTDALAHDLMVPPERLAHAIERLESFGLIERQKGTVVVHFPSLHLPRQAREYFSWHSQLRLMGLTRVANLPADLAYGFSVVFSASEKTREEVQGRFMDFVSEIQSKVRESPSHEVYQLSFDLFPWTRTRR